jgi:hypothetical protein
MYLYDENSCVKLVFYGAFVTPKWSCFLVSFLLYLTVEIFSDSVSLSEIINVE